MKIVKAISIILISLFVVTLTGCNSGASIANNDVKGNSLQNASQVTTLLTCSNGLDFFECLRA